LIQIAPQIRILVAVEAIDGRKGIDAIAQLCREKTERGSVLRLPVHFPVPEWNGHQRLAMQNRALREYAFRRGWEITPAGPARELRSSAARSPEQLLEASRRLSALSGWSKDSAPSLLAFARLASLPRLHRRRPCRVFALGHGGPQDSAEACVLPKTMGARHADASESVLDAAALGEGDDVG
jgi:hypothetical protein